MTFPYATQQQGWADFATQLDGLALGINPATLLRGQFGGKISEAIDELTVIVGGVERLSDSAAELAGVCGVQDSFDRELVSCPATKERVEKAEAEVKQAQALLRAGQCEPEVAELVIARADELAAQRREAIEKHAADTATTHFDEPESVEWPDAHYPGGGDPNKNGDDPWGEGEGEGNYGGDGQKPAPGETPEPGDKPKSPLESETPPLQSPMHPEPGSGKYMTPMTPEVRVTPLPETVTPETTLSRGDAALVSPSSNVLGQTPQAPTQQAWPQQQPQFTGVTPTQSRMLGHMNPQNAPNSRKERQEPEGTRPVPAETLAAIPVSHAVASTTPSALSPNVGTPSPTAPGTHTSSANVPNATTTPSGHTPGAPGPTPVSTVGPGSRANITGGGMREKPQIPDGLRAVLDEQTVRDLERSLDDTFRDPTPPNDPVPTPTGALR